MDASQFTLWLQGFAELNVEPPTKEQWQSIREHLQLVFTKVTPQLASPKIPDLRDSPEIRDLLEKARNDQGYQPWPPTPYFPKYFLDSPSTGGPIC